MPNEPTTAQFEAAAKWAELGCCSPGNPILALSEARLQLYGVKCHYLVWEGFSTDLAGNNVPLIINPQFDPITVHPALYCRETLSRIGPFLEAKTCVLDGRLNFTVSREDSRLSPNAAALLADGLEVAATQAFQEAYAYACGFIVDAFQLACLPTSEASLSVLFLRYEAQFFTKVDELRNQFSL